MATFTIYVGVLEGAAASTGRAPGMITSLVISTRHDPSLYLPQGYGTRMWGVSPTTQ